LQMKLVYDAIQESAQPALKSWRSQFNVLHIGPEQEDNKNEVKIEYSSWCGPWKQPWD